MTAELVLVLVAAFGAGFIDSMVGGGGLIQLPALFSAYPNTPPATLIGTNKVASIFGTVSAVSRFARTIRIPWRRLAPFCVLAFFAASGGAYTVTLIPPDIFRPLVPILLTAVLIYMLRRHDFGSRHEPRDVTGRDAWLAAALIAAIAFYDGFFGPGTGSFFMLVFIRLFGFDFLNSAACARVLNVAANGAAIIWFGARGHVVWPIAAGMAACNVAGAIIGTHTAIRRGSAFVRKVFVVVVSLLILKTAWDAIR